MAFTSLIRRSPEIVQARWIGESGRERLRVEADANRNPVIVPTAQLQDKRDRGYVQAALQLAPLEHYVSPLDLNVENGEVERPFRPMIRVCMRVFDAAGVPHGIVVFNCDGKVLLGRAVRAVNQPDLLEILNHDGHWLRSIDPSREWGFMWSEPAISFPGIFPEVWSRISHEKSGVMETSDNLWIWDTAQPVSQASGTRPGDCWKVVSRLSPAELAEVHGRVWRIVGWGAASVLLVLGAVLWLWARAEALREQAVVQGEDRLKRLLSSDMDSLLVVDPAGHVQFANPAARQLFGEPATAVGVEFALARIGGVEPKKVTVQEPGGRNRIGLLQRVPTEWQGEPAAMVTVRDITEREKAAEKLRESEQRARRVVDLSPAGFFVHNQQRRYTEVNQAACASLGYTQEELLGLTLEATYQCDDPEGTARALAALQPGEVLVRKARAMRKDGSVFPVEARLTCIEIDGETQIMRVETDMTERVATEQKLRESEAFARATVDALEARLVILDDVGDIIGENQSWREQRDPFHTEAQPIGLGSNYLEACATAVAAGLEPAGRVAAGIRTILAGRELAAVVDYELKGAKQSQFFHCLITRFGTEIPMRVVVNHNDVTALKQLEQHANRTQRLQAIGTLAGGVAHDLNNAIAPVMLGAQLLRKKHPEEHQLLDVFENGALRAAGMVKQLLSFAKGSENTEHRPIDLVPLITEMVKFIRGSFPPEIELRAEPGGKLPQVTGDPTQLHQVLLNLCVNARDAMAKGGVLTLRADVADLDATFASTLPGSRPGRFVRVTVRDNGVGMPADVLERIYEPFFSTKGPEHGTGLGLSTVFGLVQKHEGFIQVESEVGVGTTFRVYLPVAAGAAAETGAGGAAAELSGEGAKILVVDDEAPLRGIATQVLRNWNFDPLTAADGVEGLQLLVENRHELAAVIVDRHMPHMDGLAFVKALRRVSPTVGVIVTSGRLSESDRAEFEELQVACFLPKPYSGGDLGTALGNLPNLNRGARSI